jgi:hypothetical protein
MVKVCAVLAKLLINTLLLGITVGLAGVAVPVNVEPVVYWYFSVVKPINLSIPLLWATAPAQVGGVMLAVTLVGCTQAELTDKLLVAVAVQTPVPLLF